MAGESVFHMKNKKSHSNFFNFFFAKLVLMIMWQFRADFCFLFYGVCVCAISILAERKTDMLLKIVLK